MKAIETLFLSTAVVLASSWSGAMAFVSEAHAGRVPLAAEQLRCESLSAPLGVEVTHPCLSWQLDAKGVRGQRQTAYRILVASTPDSLAKDIGDLWDSGKVTSDQSINVEYSGKELASRQECHWKVRVWDKDGKASAWSAPAFWGMGLLKPEDWRGKWIQLAGGDENDCPFLRATFDLPEKPAQAVARLNIAGYAELYVNGQKIGTDVLSPAVSLHFRRTFYLSYDVAPYLRKGRNVIGIWLGRGWAMTKAKGRVRAQLETTVAGQPWVFATGTHWKATSSAYRHIGHWQWGDFGGESLDARVLLPGWSTPEFDDHAWPPAAEATAPCNVAVSQLAPPNRIGKVIEAVAVNAGMEPPPPPPKSSAPSSPSTAPLSVGTPRYEIDFGTCLTGWLRIKMPKLEAGTKVTFTFADKKTGANTYQTFNQVSEFIAAGREGEVFENKFNYAGFRYVLVKGLPAAPAKEDAQALLVESDLETVGDFRCSNDLLNRIHHLNQWTQRCLNLGGYYVDCPHRERMGYGDGQVATEGFMTSFRADGFYRKWLQDWVFLQGKDGGLPNTAPFGGGGGGPAWPGALPAIAWRHYLYYGDRRVLEENYEAIDKYLAFLESKCKDNVLRKYDKSEWSFIGDWVPPRRGMDTKNWPGLVAAELFNNCYRIYLWELREKMAAALGQTNETAQCRERIKGMREAVHAAFFDAEHQRYVIDEQAYYVMPLMTGVTPEALRPAVLKNLERCILETNKGHLDTGMLGTYFLMEYLRTIGRNDLVYTMFTRTDDPGWGYMLAQGATTCWEQWNGFWSQIHSCFTSGGNWLYQGPGGIRPDDSAAGFKRVLIAPSIVGDLTFVNCWHVGPYGRIECNWKREAGQLAMQVVIPPNTTARVFVPAADAAGVTESGKPVSDATGVRFLRMERGCAVYEVVSGEYRFATVAKQSSDPASWIKITAADLRHEFPGFGQSPAQ